MNNLIHFIHRNVARLLEKRIKNELPVFESSESICRVIIVIVIVIITIEYRHVGKQCNDKRTWTTSNITLIQHFDRLYPETSDRYRLTPRNTAYWPNALFIPIFVETFARVLSFSSPFSSNGQNRLAETSEDEKR